MGLTIACFWANLEISAICHDLIFSLNKFFGSFHNGIAPQIYWNLGYIMISKMLGSNCKFFVTRRPRTSGIFSAPNLFEKDYWTTNLFLVDSFQHSNLRSLSKIWQKLHKKHWKLENFGFFVIFGFNLIYFSFRKQSLSLRKSILDNEFLPFLSRWAFSTF